MSPRFLCFCGLEAVLDHNAVTTYDVATRRRHGCTLVTEESHAYAPPCRRVPVEREGGCSNRGRGTVAMAMRAVPAARCTCATPATPADRPVRVRPALRSKNPLTRVRVGKSARAAPVSYFPLDIRIFRAVSGDSVPCRRQGAGAQSAG